MVPGQPQGEEGVGSPEAPLRSCSHWKATEAWEPCDGLAHVSGSQAGLVAGPPILPMASLVDTWASHMHRVRPAPVPEPSPSSCLQCTYPGLAQVSVGGCTRAQTPEAGLTGGPKPLVPLFELESRGLPLVASLLTVLQFPQTERGRK